VLIDIAIFQKRPDEVIQWFDKLRATQPKPAANAVWAVRDDCADRVAKAVAESHPNRALEIYGRQVGEFLKQADRTSYETVASYLRKRCGRS
jgi:uncharacterized Zn finger protein